MTKRKMNLMIARAKRSMAGRVLCRVLGDERGAVAMEYVIIALLVAAAVVGVVMVFGSRIANMFNQSTKALTSKESEMEQLGKDVQSSRDKDAGRSDKANAAGDTIRGTDNNGGGEGGSGEGSPE